MHMAYYAFYKDFIIDNFLCIKCINVAAFMWPGYTSLYSNGSGVGCGYNCKLYPRHKDLHVLYCAPMMFIYKYTYIYTNGSRLHFTIAHVSSLFHLSPASNEYVAERRYAAPLKTVVCNNWNGRCVAYDN